MKIHLVIIEVSSMEKSLLFYHGLIGMPIEKQFVNGRGAEIAMLGDASGTQLELICKDGQASNDWEKGMAISFVVKDAEMILEQTGRPFTGPISPGPDMRFFYTSDPDGYRVQLQEVIH